jgi:hypothetical protein
VLSFHAVTEERVDPRERERAPANHGTRRHRAPQDVRAGEFPNRQQTGHDRNEDAYARRPEGKPSDHLGVQKASSRLVAFGVLRIVRHGLLTLPQRGRALLACNDRRAPALASQAKLYGRSLPPSAGTVEYN